MIFGTQFTGSVNPGQTRTWFTHSWNANHNVVWMIIPTSPAVDGPAQVEWNTVDSAGRQPGEVVHPGQERHQRSDQLSGPVRRTERLRPASR